MPRRLFAVPAAALALFLGAAPILAASPFPSIIDLPNGWAPEGITAGRGTTVYAGSLADGAIAQVDVRTGATRVLAPGEPGRVAVGIDYEDGAHRLWVAGGPTGEVRVHDAATGAVLATYPVSAGFLNDVVVTRDAAYVTDSFVQQLIVIPLERDGSLPSAAAAFSLPITGDLVYGPGFNANGIVEFAGFLLVPQSVTGDLFAIDPATGNSVRLLDGAVTFADGLELVGSTLYVVRNELGLIDVYRIHGADVRLRGTITSPDLDVPTTVAFAAGRLWAVNARFGTPVTPDTEYWITRLPTR